MDSQQICYQFDEPNGNAKCQQVTSIRDREGQQRGMHPCSQDRRWAGPGTSGADIGKSSIGQVEQGTLVGHGAWSTKYLPTLRSEASWGTGIN